MATKEDNYITKIKALITQGKISKEPRTFGFLEVLHDDWCGVFGDRLCDCDPIIKLNGKPVSPAAK